MACYNSKIVNAPIAKVWSAIRDFHDMSWAKGVIETCENVGGVPGTQIGARRKLNGVFVETLLALDEDGRTMKYSIDEGPGPVASAKGYVGQVRLLPLTDGDKTFVEWTSSWKDEAGGVKAFCDSVYQAALGAMAANVR